MSLKQPSLSDKLRTRGDVGVAPNNFAYAALIPVKLDGTIDLNPTFQGPGKFLLNPSVWEESKSSNWIPIPIPGQSDPVFQWVSSGARTVSFEALVTKETSYFESAVQGKQATPSTAQKTVNSVLGSIAGSFFNVVLPAPRNNPINPTEAISPAQLDISNILDYYRSLLYPVYDDIKNPHTLEQSPPLLTLFVGKSLSRIPNGTKISTNSDVWILTNIKIRTTKQLPNLVPIEASVEFQLSQYNIRSFSRQRFL